MYYLENKVFDIIDPRCNHEVNPYISLIFLYSYLTNLHIGI